MQLRYCFGVAVAVILILPVHCVNAQSGNRTLVEPVVDTAIESTIGSTSSNFSSANFGSSSVNNDSQLLGGDYGGTTGTGMIDYVSGNHSRSLINLNCCGGRRAVRPPCMAVPSYGGNYCIGRAHGRPILGRWCGF